MENNNQNYRAYFFSNMYLNSISNGIQAAHAIGEMTFRAHSRVFTYSQMDIFYHWLEHDKTIIILNGGYSKNLETIYETIKSNYHSETFPYAIFHEEIDALNGAATSVGIIIPESIWGTPPFTGILYDGLDDETIGINELRILINSYSLAR